MKHPWRYFVSAFVGALFAITWIGWFLDAVTRPQFWHVTILFGVGGALFGGFAWLGIWWAER